MPNTPALLGAGASALAGGTSASEDDFIWAEGVLSSLGVVARLPEYQLDAVTGLSGSGPAYVFLLAEALVEAGVNEGLDREVSRLFAVQTLLGSARLLAETGDSPEALRAAVTSPGGTTAAALRVLEAHGFRSAVLEAVAAAAIRSRELGRNELTAGPARGCDRPDPGLGGTLPLCTSATLAYIRDWRRGVMQLSTIEYAKARFSTVAEVARALRVSNMTVYRLIKLGTAAGGACRQVVPAA